jgi:hypothetical protein
LKVCQETFSSAGRRDSIVFFGRFNPEPAYRHFHWVSVDELAKQPQSDRFSLGSNPDKQI